MSDVCQESLQCVGSELERNTGGRLLEMLNIFEGVLIFIPFLLGCSLSGPLQRRKNILYRIIP